MRSSRACPQVMLLVIMLSIKDVGSPQIYLFLPLQKVAQDSDGLLHAEGPRVFQSSRNKHSCAVFVMVA